MAGRRSSSRGRRRFKVGAVTAEDPYFKAQVVLLQEEEAPKEQDFEAYVSNIKDLASQIIQLSPNIPSEASIILKNIENPSFLIHFISSNLNTELHEKQQLLEIHHIKSRADLLMQLLQRELQFAELKNKLTNRTKTELDKQQREYFLQQQLKSIKDELGGDSNEREVKEMQKKAETKKWPATAKELFRKGDRAVGADASQHAGLFHCLQSSRSDAGVALGRLFGGFIRSEEGEEDPGSRSLWDGQGEGADPGIPGGAQAERGI